MCHPDPARKLSANLVWHIPLLYVQWKTPDDVHRNCLKHVEFHFKNKLEKLVHLVGFIIRNTYAVLLINDIRKFRSQIVTLLWYCDFQERHRTKQLLAQQEILFPRLFWSFRSALHPLISFRHTGEESRAYARHKKQSQSQGLQPNSDELSSETEEEPVL